jgi:DNA processing protein
MPELHEGRKEKILEKIAKVDEEKIEKYLNEKGVEIVTIDSPEYPKNLRSIGHAPAFLYLRGILDPDVTLIGVVGSRKHTPYAERILHKILPDIIQAGV